MSEFRFKPRQNVITIKVERENEGGEVESKDLVLNCSATNFNFVQNLSTMKAAIDAMAASGFVDGEILKVVEAEKKVFEAMAPGKWDEFFEFLDGDIADMTELLTVATDKVKGSLIKQRGAEIVPEKPNGEEI